MSDASQLPMAVTAACSRYPETMQQYYGVSAEHSLHASKSLFRTTKTLEQNSQSTPTLPAAAAARAERRRGEQARPLRVVEQAPEQILQRQRRTGQLAGAHRLAENADM